MENISTKKTSFKGVIMLLFAAFIWGTSFVAQEVGADSIPAFTFNGIRTLMGVAVLLPIIIIKDFVTIKKHPLLTDKDKEMSKKAVKTTIISGCILGLVLCVASNFQQYAFYYTTSGKVALITALYMFIVPIFGLFFRKKVSILTWLCIVIGFIGVFFLSMKKGEGFDVNIGDVLAFCCSIVYAVHIILIEKFAPQADGLKLSCLQFFVSGVLTCCLMFIFEEPNTESINKAMIPLLYSGILSCGCAYTFQILGQKYTESTIASLIMCTESLFGVVSSVIILHEDFSSYKIVGCVIMTFAIVLSQVSDVLTEKIKTKFKKDKKQNTQK